MTKISYNIVNEMNRVVETGVKSYPQAAVKAANIKGQVVTVYTPIEIKDEYPLPKHRLVAHF